MSLPGGITSVYSFIDVDNETEIKGSFNTTYVYTYDSVTLFQSYFFGNLANKGDGSATMTEIPDYYSFTSEENKQRGLIQKEQSITSALIVAFEAAKENGYDVNLDYEFKGLIIQFYAKNQKVLKIGDVITKIKIVSEDKTYDTSSPSDLENAFYKSNVGDIVTYRRGDMEYEYVLDCQIANYSDAVYKDMTAVSQYRYYVIDEETANPKYRISNTNTLGPSGGFLQTLAVYCQITGKDLTNGKKIGGTGTIIIDDDNGILSGYIGAIGAEKEKIQTCIREGIDIFLCPSQNYDSALAAYNKILGHEKMLLVKIENDRANNISGFKNAITFLEGLANE